jgi:methylmalonyl-CoA/ethylmalonyl-CoA epimerase
MTDDELREFNKKRKIHQLGIVVKNLDEAIKAWQEIYMVGPWTVMEFSNKNVTGIVSDRKSIKEVFKYRIAASYIGELQIELIEANDSMPIYQEFLEKTGGGLHHIKEKISNDKIDEQLSYFAEKGMGLMFGGYYYNINFYYPDTVQKLGVQLELGNCEKIIKP